MVRLIVGFSVIFWTSVGSAEEVLREISWQEVGQGARGSEDGAGQAQTELEGETLRVSNATAQPATVAVLTLEDPPITSATYAITGKVRYEDIEGDGYLEMWSCFDRAKRYYSRTLSKSGPSGVLTGSAGWRRFVLPFYSKQGVPPPQKLLINVVLPARGRVWLSPLRLVQYGPGQDPLAAPGQWWSDRTGGLMGGVLGTILGCLGGLIGWLTAKGKARNVVFGSVRAMQAVGVGSLLGGVVAVIMSQPYCVYYPFLLVGIICLAVGTGVVHTVRKRFDELELRKMSAMDAV